MFFHNVAILDKNEVTKIPFPIVVSFLLYKSKRSSCVD